ncbi:ER membrane protein complex subunit 7 homolog [Typha latifolia]|uniref:ER membrane protein complex subunit 7 homolog n=1 Tax=Typha latifolia TaxID=4733 RepID=UPI003C2BAAF5
MGQAWIKSYCLQVKIPSFEQELVAKGLFLPLTTRTMKRSAASVASLFAPSLLLFFLPLASLFFSLAVASPSGSGDGYIIAGRVKLEGMGSKGFGLSAKMSNTKVILNGGQRVTFVRPDGYFSFHNVPAGTHLIEVASMGYFFSPVRVDVSARNPGKVQAALTENKRLLNELILEPLSEEHYYEVRQPFSVMSLLKSPMGMMVGFMLVMVFLMPKLMENIDPEEMKRAQEEMRAQGVPSLSGLLSRGS